MRVNRTTKEHEKMLFNSFISKIKLGPSLIQRPNSKEATIQRNNSKVLN